MRLKLDARGRRLVRLLPVVNVYSAAELVLMALLAVQCARLAWVVLTPVTPLGDWRPPAPLLAGSARDVLGGFDPFFRLGGGGGPAVVTPLQLTLFGTRMNDATGRGSAIIAGADGVQKSIAVGEDIQAGVRLKAVAFDHVTIDRGGAAEDLFLDQSGHVAPVVPGGNPPPPPSGGGVPAPGPGGGVPVGQLRSEIGFTPRLAGGRLTGLIVRPEGTGAVFRQANLREGDVLTAIGGRPVTGPGDLDRITTDFAGGGVVPITIERGQDTLALSITIAASK